MKHILSLISILFLLTGCGGHITNPVSKVADSVRIAQLEKMQDRGSELRNLSRFDEAIACHDSCINEAQEINDTLQWIMALNNQGTNFRRLGDMQQASSYHYKALELCDDFDDKKSAKARKNRVKSLNGLGNVLLDMNNRKAAEEYFKEALKGETELGSATGQAINLANIGSIKEKEGKLDSARVYYLKSMEKNIEAENNLGISLCYNYLGEIDKKEGRMEKALENFHKSFEIGSQLKDTWHLLNPCLSLGRIYMSQQNYPQAKKYIELAISNAKDINSLSHLADAYELKSDLEEHTGQTLLALQDIKQSHILRDSINVEEAQTDLQNMRVNYESKRRSEELKAAEANASNAKAIRNVTIIFAIILLIIFIIVIRILIRSNRIKKEANQLQERHNKERMQFYRGITHQLRTPLTVVVGMVKQLEQYITPDKSDGMVLLKAAQRQSDELLALVTRLLNAAREDTDIPLSDINNSIVTTNTSTSSATTTEEAYATAKDTPTGSADMPFVLIAEDNDDVAILMKNIFANNGYRTLHARDGQEALEMLSEELPDLVITDIAMPRMDGLELIRNIREDDTMNHLPIIVVSARVEDNERLEGVKAGAEVYLAKPFIPEELILRAKKILEQRQLLRRKFQGDSFDLTIENCNDKEKDFLLNINRILLDNLSKGAISSSKLADMLCMTSSQLNRRIKNITGMNTTSYIREQAMNRARYLLVVTDYSINDIAQMCGFESTTYFTRIFHEATEMTATEYRAKNK